MLVPPGRCLEIVVYCTDSLDNSLDFGKFARLFNHMLGDSEHVVELGANCATLSLEIVLQYHKGVGLPSPLNSMPCIIDAFHGERDAREPMRPGRLTSLVIWQGLLCKIAPSAFDSTCFPSSTCS